MFGLRQIRQAWRRLAWAVIYSGPKRDITLETANGVLTFDNQDWMIGKILYLNRSYEVEQMDAAVKLLHEEGYLTDDTSSMVLDVGANIGMICVALVRSGRFKKALAFEPAPNSYRLLLKNVCQNNLESRITCFPFALSSSQGQVVLELSPDNSGDHRIRQTESKGAFGEELRPTICVEARTLDSFFAGNPELSPHEVSLVWVDIQGHEGHFLEGARRFLTRGVPMVAEVWPYALGRSGFGLSRFRTILSEFYTHFYVLSGKAVEKSRVSAIGQVFRAFAGRREACQVVLVRDRSEALHYHELPRR
jgi:FkbM family methyltransferase